MKNKIFLFILALIFGIFIPVSASGIEVQPTMISRSNAQDRAWVGTFQLVWNDFIDKYIHNPIRFREGTPREAFELNLRTFSVNDISEKCYYLFSGPFNKKTKKTIENGLKKKFNEKSDILAQENPSQNQNKYLIYAMLKKDFKFLHEFDKLGKSKFGKDMTAEYFGIDNSSEKELREGVKVLFFNNDNDYAVVLATKDNEEVYLYKNSSNKPFRAIYDDMKFKAHKYNGQKEFGSGDRLKVPDIKLDLTRNFDEFTNKRIMGTNFEILKAVETIKFKMNNKGVELKSEAAIIAVGCALKPESPRRNFYFDDTFVIFLKEKDKNSPYFALRVNDIKKFQ